MKKFTLCFIFLTILSQSMYSQQTIGLFQNEEESFEGYTLFASTSYTSHYLIDNCGELVNEWPGQYRPGIASYLEEDGFLYRAVRNPGGSFFGGGLGGEIEKVDWEGNIVWSYRYANNQVHQHHDLEVLPNGNVLILAWEAKGMQEAIDEGHDPSLEGAVWPEHIIEVEPVGVDEGNIVWEWHLWDHMVQSIDPQKPNFGAVEDHPELMDINFKGNNASFVQADWIHANAIDYNPIRDEIIISSRHLSEIWIIDHSTTTEEAAGHSGGNAGKGGDFLYRWGNPRSYKRGSTADKKLFGQHDAHWIPEGLTDAGKIMIFNNGLDRPEGNYSSVDIIVPPIDSDGNYIISENEPYGPEELDWTYYPAEDDPSFFSKTVSGAQRLPNGNTLICQGGNGILFEIDENKEKVWQYICPVSNGGPMSQGIDPSGNGVFRAYRYDADYPALIGKDLTPGEVVELDPMISVCDSTVSTVDVLSESVVKLFPNPVDLELHIQSEGGNVGKLKIVDPLGNVLLNKEVNSPRFIFPTIHLQEGIYFLMINEGEVRKFICKH
ncbi:MAG: aryl-sulfate sulfotransferase [Saprospiraceae bacterium]